MLKSTLSVGLLATLLGGISIASQESKRTMPDVGLMTVDPGHFHAALVQREMYPGVAERVDIYAPVGPDLTEHLNRIVAFNRRGEQPTRWALEVHASPDFFQRMLHEHPGNVVILSGRDRKSTRLNSSHRCISYAVFCLKKQSATGVD